MAANLGSSLSGLNSAMAWVNPALAVDQLNLSGQGGVAGINAGQPGLLDQGRDALTGQGATDRALAAQQAGATAATKSTTDAYNQQRADLKPYQDAGATALNSLSNNDFMKNYQQDPGYQFRLEEGNKAINASAAARGMNNSGATMKALTQYGQDYATNDYNNAYNRNYTRLSGLAGMGGNTAGQLSNAAGQYGSNLAGIQTGMANATASAQIAQSNRQAGLIGSGMTAGAMAFSDERLKTGIEPISSEDLAEMKSYLKAYYFNYKSKQHGEGDWAGVMAQDLQKSKLGRTLVSEDESGHLQVDMKKVMSVFLATMAEA